MDSPELTPLAIAALGLLFERQAHPYEASQLLAQRRRDRVVRITPGSLYRTIERLVDDGLARVVGTERAGNRPERTVYEITDAGRTALRQNIEAMVAEPRPGFPALNFALSELHNLSAEVAIDRLEERVEAQHAALAENDALAATADQLGVPEAYVLDLEYQRSVLEHEIAWIDGLIARIRDRGIVWFPGISKDSPSHSATANGTTRSDPQEAATR